MTKTLGFPQWFSGTESAWNSGYIENAVRSLGWEDPLEEEMASHSSILAWEIPWTKKPGGLSQTWLNTEWRKHWSIDSALWAQIMNHRVSVPISPLWGTLQTPFPRCKVNQMPRGPLGLILMELFCTPKWVPIWGGWTGEGWLSVVSIAFHFPESQAVGFPEWQFQTADVGWATKDPWQIMDLSQVCRLVNELPPISVLTTMPPLV